MLLLGFRLKNKVIWLGVFAYAFNPCTGGREWQIPESEASLVYRARSRSPRTMQGDLVPCP